MEFIFVLSRSLFLLSGYFFPEFLSLLFFSLQNKTYWLFIQKLLHLKKKYAIKLNYEDAFNDLQLYFIECILKIPLESGNFVKSDYYILSYIKKSIYFGYVALSKKIQKENYRNILCENDYTIDKIFYENNLYVLEDELFKNDIMKILNEK